MIDVLKVMPEMYVADALEEKLAVLPLYDDSICTKNMAERLVALQDIYGIYIPSRMSKEIYSKLYLALLRSLHKKRSHNAHIQRNINHKYICRKECGGILGGISTGMPIVLRVAFKPTPSIARQQDTIRLSTLEETPLEITGRHDPCIVPRAVPVVEAAAALVLLDALLDAPAHF